MNSPPEPASPSASTPSSGSPPPEDVSHASSGGTNSTVGITAVASQIGSHISSFLGTGNASKRRLPGGSSFGALGSARDPKSRRREDSRRQSTTGNTTGIWIEAKEGGGGKRDKEDLVDQMLVEMLRKEIGDPFTESVLRVAS